MLLHNARSEESQASICAVHTDNESVCDAIPHRIRLLSSLESSKRCSHAALVSDKRYDPNNL